MTDDQPFQSLSQVRLGERLEALRAELTHVRDEMRALNSHTYSRVERLDKLVAEMETDRERRREITDDRTNALTLALEKLSGRLTLWVGALAVFVIVVGAVVVFVK